MRGALVGGGVVTAGLVGAIFFAMPVRLFYEMPLASAQVVTLTQKATQDAYDKTIREKTTGDGVLVPWQSVLALDAALLIQDFIGVTSENLATLIWSDFIIRTEKEVCVPKDPGEAGKATGEKSAPDTHEGASEGGTGVGPTVDGGDGVGDDPCKKTGDVGVPDCSCTTQVSFSERTLETVMANRGLDSNTQTWILTMRDHADWLVIGR